jgi:L-gulonolactone oxidase
VDRAHWHRDLLPHRGADRGAGRHRVDYEPYFRAVEAIANEVAGRPHWGKLHWLDAAALRERYPHFDDAMAVRDRVDPNRIFSNVYTKQVFGS